MTMDEFDRETARFAAEKAEKLAHYAPTEERRKAAAERGFSICGGPYEVRRSCVSIDLFTVSEGLQCGNCLAVTTRSVK